tara:strand:- start:125809 stop:127014 length:1206 start_codon:yes stop_codon:yes gene_type:complete
MIIFLLLSSILSPAYGYSFKEVVQTIETHPAVEALTQQAQRLKFESVAQSSWGDPKLRVRANNFPEDSLADNKTPMTGTQIILEQNFPLTTKYSHIENSYELMGEAKKHMALDQKRQLLKLLWDYSFAIRKLSKDQNILKQNYGWLKNMIKVSKRLYSNGKLSQQALLELQIRLAEVEADLSNTKYSLKEIHKNLNYIAQKSKGNLNLSSVPWSSLKVDLKKNPEQDEVEKALEKELKSTKSIVRARQLNYIPDVTLSVGYTKRSDEVDDVGNFVSAGIGFSLPLSSKRYAIADSAQANQIKVLNKLKDYRLRKSSLLKKLALEIRKSRSELSIIENKSLVFAKSARDITSKSYGLGGTSYIELLQAELKYQNLAIRKNKLEAELAGLQVKYLFLSGDKLI